MTEAETEAVRDRIRRLPKAELHIHLEGAIRPETAVALAAKNGVALPGGGDPVKLYDYDGLPAFLAVYGAIAQAIVTADDFRRIAYEMLESCAASGARYVEFFLSLHAHDVPFATQLEGIRAGIAEAEADFGIVSRMIPGVNRELGPAAGEEYLDAVLALRGDDLIGIGLDYNEPPHPPEPYAALFARARAAGLHVSAHAGETGPASFISGSLDALKIERVDHGYAVMDDPALVERCRAEGVCFTCCPTTTVYTTRWKDLDAADHAIRRMREAGLTVTIHSDDPPMFNTDLAAEYVAAHEKLGFSLDDLKASILASLSHSWLDAATKAAWRAEWSREIDAVLAGA